MLNELTPEQEKEYSKWAQDNYHQKVGVSGNISAMWHPAVRKEMYRLKRLQLEVIRRKASELNK